MKSFRVLVLVQLILLVFLVSSQYDPYTLINTQLGFSFSTAVSDYNGDIFVGGLFKIQRYDKQGYFIQEITMHSGAVIQLFWANDYLISVGDDGQIIKWDSTSFGYQSEVKADSGVLNADVGNGYLALNYGNKIDEYSLDFMTYYSSYTTARNATFTDVCYSKMDYSFYLWALAPGYKFRFTRGFNSYFQYNTPYIFQSLDIHPSKNNHIMVSTAGSIYETDSSQIYNPYYSYNSMGFAIYSPNGNYVLSSYLQNQVMIWDSSRNAIEQIDGWTCSIVSISQNAGVVSVLDACGNLGIIYQSNSFSISIWIILVVAFIVIMIASIICIQICRKRRLAQQLNQGGYSGPTSQGISPNWNQQENHRPNPYNGNYNPVPINANQGFSANTTNPYVIQQSNSYGNQPQNQGFNNQGYQPPARSW